MVVRGGVCHGQPPGMDLSEFGSTWNFDFQPSGMEIIASME